MYRVAILLLMLVLCCCSYTSAVMEKDESTSIKLFEQIKAKTDYSIYIVPERYRQSRKWEVHINEDQELLELYYVDLDKNKLSLLLLECEVDSCPSTIKKNREYDEEIKLTDGHVAYYAKDNTLSLSKNGTYVLLGSKEMSKQELIQIASILKKLD